MTWGHIIGDLCIIGGFIVQARTERRALRALERECDEQRQRADEAEVQLANAKRVLREIAGRGTW